MTDRRAPLVEVALLPCPFCGSDKIRLGSRDRYLVFIVCDGCKTSSNIYVEREDAVKAWNTRATLPLAAVLDAIAEPSEAMLNDPALIKFELKTGILIRDMWRAMIAALRKEIECSTPSS